MDFVEFKNRINLIIENSSIEKIISDFENYGVKMEAEVYCTNCKWEGLTKELDGIKCPECGESKYIEDAEPEYDYDNQILGGGKFNWNKK